MSNLIKWLSVPLALVLFFIGRSLFHSLLPPSEWTYEGTYVNFSAQDGDLIHLQNVVQATIRSEKSHRLVHVDTGVLAHEASDPNDLMDTKTYSTTLAAGTWLVEGEELNIYLFSPTKTQVDVKSAHPGGGGMLILLFGVGVLLWLVGSLMLDALSESVASKLDKRKLSSNSSASSR